MLTIMIAVVTEVDFMDDEFFDSIFEHILEAAKVSNKRPAPRLLCFTALWSLFNLMCVF